jgi:hypothetical protein
MLQQGQQKQPPLGKTKTTKPKSPSEKKKKKNRENNRTMKNSLSVVDKQIKENRGKIALTTSATEEEEEEEQKHKAGNTSEKAPVPETNTREGREDRDRTF